MLKEQWAGLPEEEKAKYEEEEKKEMSMYIKEVELWKANAPPKDKKKKQQKK